MTSNTQNKPARLPQWLGAPSTTPLVAGSRILNLLLSFIYYLNLLQDFGYQELQISHFRHSLILFQVKAPIPSFIQLQRSLTLSYSSLRAHLLILTIKLTMPSVLHKTQYSLRFMLNAQFLAFYNANLFTLNPSQTFLIWTRVDFPLFEQVLM